MLEKLKKFIKKHWDKVLHSGANFVIALSAFVSYPFALGACIGVSVGKEYGDSKAAGNKWSWGDIVADALGMGTGLLIVFLIKKLF